MASYLFFDWETQSLADLPVTGTLKYVLDPSTRPLLLSWAIDDAPVKLWCPDLGDELAPEVWAYVETRMADYGPPPVMVGVHCARPDGYVVAWNCAFDRACWQQIATPEYDFLEIRIEQTLDAMAAAQASNLPGSLEWAGRALGLGHKTIGGKAIMQRFARRQEPLPGTPADLDKMTAAGRTAEQAIEAAIAMWQLYLDYSVQDTELMRAVWKTARPLDAAEWQEYWVSERINDRGMLADLDVCAGAVKYREEEAAHVTEQIKLITNGEIAGPTFTAQINKWLYDRLPDDLREFMVKARDEDSGEVTKITAAKSVMTRLLEEIQASDAPPEDAVIDFLELLEFGRSSSAVKFEKILNQQVDGRLGGSYVFNGAGQTGRYCVAPDTLIDTPCGNKPIVDLRIGDKVITHLGRKQPVTAVIYKGREQMYRLTASNGATVTATGAHRLMTESGWKRLDECFEIGNAGPCSPRKGCTPISCAYALNDRDRRAVRGDARHSERDHSRGDTGRGTEATMWREPVSVEDGGRQPDVREKDCGREDITQGARGGVEWEWVHVRAPLDSSACAWIGSTPVTSGNSSHRRGQDEQRYGQSGGNNETRTQVPAQAVIWEVVPVGEGEVWDISVAGDASYSAQGLMHHNSSRGVQVHNLPRAALKNELDVLDMVAGGVPIERLREIGPVSSVLSKLIRPTFMAPEGKLLVWGDWSAIEARVNPWLANSRDAERAVLDIFRACDADPAQPDVYVYNAGAIFNTPADVIWERYQNGDPEAKGQRQAGKVAVLALGFLGSVGALKAMARGYGMRLSNEEAKLIVDAWRDRNRWARRFGDQCEQAAFAAMRQPMSIHAAGRVQYQFAPDLMGGTLVGFLPDMRPIVYPKARITKTEKFGKEVDAIVYLNGMGYRSLWNGLQVENATQATAASILRATLTRLEAEEHDAETVFHTHDEIGAEVDETEALSFSKRLESVMIRGFDWTEGLPLAAEISTSWYYTKSP